MELSTWMEKTGIPSIDDSIDAAAVSLNFHPLKTKQCKAVEAFMRGNDVFVALPTGYGKSVIFGILPTAYDLFCGHTESKSIAIIVSPLAALIKDMKEKFVPRGVNAEFLGELQEDPGAIARVVDGKHQLVFVSPENLLENPLHRGMLASEVYQNNLVAVVVDEAHCIEKW